MTFCSGLGDCFSVYQALTFHTILNFAPETIILSHTQSWIQVRKEEINSWTQNCFHKIIFTEDRFGYLGSFGVIFSSSQWTGESGCRKVGCRIWQLESSSPFSFKPTPPPSQGEISGAGVLNKVLESWFYQTSQVLLSASSVHDEMSSKMRWADQVSLINRKREDIKKR